MKILYFFLLLAIVGFNLYSQALDEGTIPEIRVDWEFGKPRGIIRVTNGTFKKIKIDKGRGRIYKEEFHFASDNNNRLIIQFDSVQIGFGAGATLVTIETEENPFSFFLRDVDSDHPIYVPEYGVLVLPAEDSRTLEAIKKAISLKNLKSKEQQIEAAPEESFKSAGKYTRDQQVPTWLGVSRDIRIFQITQNTASEPFEREVISPKNAYTSLYAPGSQSRHINYSYVIGRGQGVRPNLKRRLEDGVLPILNSQLTDGGIDYRTTMFTSFESSPLSVETSYGTDFLVADSYLAGSMFTEHQEEVVEERLKEFNQLENEQTVLYHRTVATNNDEVPRYAWFKSASPGRAWWDRFDYSFDKGYSRFSDEEIFVVAKLNGKPAPNEEIAVMLKPGDSVIFEFYIPHSPVSKSRARQLMDQSFDQRYTEAKNFWNAKLNRAAWIRLPEKRIEEMIRAGLLHLDLSTYGKEPDGALAPSIGIYAPIGTESAPIIQFYMSMGYFDEAKRALMYFLEKQHDDGMIQNFGGYMVETGAVLWSIGEYFRYTQDTSWLLEVKPKLIKSSDFLINWRNEHKRPELKNKGYGLIAGKVADPDDPFHQFMLNGYGYLGLSRMAESLNVIDKKVGERYRKEAKEWKADIHTSFFYAMSHSPVVPLGDGTWSPTAPPWTEGTGPRALYVNEETFYSHGTFTVADVLLGPLYLVFCEVLDYNDPVSKRMLDYHRELFYQENSAFSQPYYSRHNWLQLKNGMVKPFLNTYYNTFSALADRETYTFWEHLYHASPHKTHEEAWFLMETRWMLWHEEGNTLKFLSTIPRRWMENGKNITLDNVKSYFGPIKLSVHSEIDQGFMTADIQRNSFTKPDTVTIRLPHPEGKRPKKVIGGVYDPEYEKVLITPFSGTGKIRLEF